LPLYKRKYRPDSVRLKGWDYRWPNWYFLTILTKDRRHFFGEIKSGVMGLSKMGCIAYRNCAAIPDHFEHVTLDAFIVMPNHVHGLIGIMDWPQSIGGGDAVTVRDLVSLQVLLN
jgi:hypothetical protein